MSSVSVGDCVDPDHLPMQFDVFRSFNSFGRDVRVFRKYLSTHWLAKPLVWQRIDPGVEAFPTFNLECEVDAQNLMDALWSSGVRPSNGEGNVGMIGAMRDHLADLRRAVEFHHGEAARRPVT